VPRHAGFELALVFAEILLPLPGAHNVANALAAAALAHMAGADAAAVRDVLAAIWLTFTCRPQW